MDQDHLAILGCNQDVVSAWQDADVGHIVEGIMDLRYGIRLFTGRLDQASSKVFALLQVKETDVPVGVSADEEGLELVHGDAQALLFGDDEIEVMLQIKHIPNFDHAIVPGATDKVVLIEFVQIVCSGSHLLLRGVLVRCDVLEVERGQRMPRVVARLKLDREPLKEVHQPEGTICRDEDRFSCCLVIERSRWEAI